MREKGLAAQNLWQKGIPLTYNEKNGEREAKETSKGDVT